jgi:hypothetical protein
MQSGRDEGSGAGVAASPTTARTQALPAKPSSAFEPTPDTPDAAWIEADPALFTGLPLPWEHVTDARQVLLDRQQIIAAGPGSKLALFIPQLSSFLPGAVEHVKKSPSGNLSVRGHINGDRRFGFVLTLGRESTFATIGTPQGIFNLTGNAEVAWIVAQRELDHQIDPSQPDFVVSQAKQLTP